MEREKIIAENFKLQAKEIHDYIAKTSPQNAEKFMKKLLEEIDKIEKNPEANPPVTNFENKSLRYRYRIFMKSFKIVYKLLKKALVFVGLLHKNQSNAAYKELRKKE